MRIGSAWSREARCETRFAVVLSQQCCQLSSAAREQLVDSDSAVLCLEACVFLTVTHLMNNRRQFCSKLQLATVS